MSSRGLLNAQECCRLYVADNFEIIVFSTNEGTNEGENKIKEQINLMAFVLDEFLDPVNHVEIAVFNIANVPRVQPPLRINYFRSGFWVGQVPFHHLGGKKGQVGRQDSR